MALADSLHEQLSAQRRRRCHLGRSIDEMPDADRTAIANAIEQVRAYRATSIVRNGHTPMTAAAIRRALIAEGYDISKDTVEKHVAGTCACND